MPPTNGTGASAEWTELATGFTAPMTKEYILLQGGFHTLAAIAGTLRINWKVERPRMLNFASAVPFAA